MTKAAKFDAFLAENKITCFAKEEVKKRPAYRGIPCAYGSKRANAADNGCCR